MTPSACRFVAVSIPTSPGDHRRRLVDLFADHDVDAELFAEFSRESSFG